MHGGLLELGEADGSAGADGSRERQGHRGGVPLGGPLGPTQAAGQDLLGLGGLGLDEEQVMNQTQF